jgi:hypothetical protein
MNSGGTHEIKADNNNFRQGPIDPELILRSVRVIWTKNRQPSNVPAS